MFANRHFWDELVIQSYKTILKQKPGSPIVHHNLGIAYVRVNKLNKAVRSFQRAIKFKKDYAEAYYHLGTTYQKLGKRVEAIRCFTNYNKHSACAMSGKSIVPDLLDKLKEEMNAEEI